MVTRDVDFVVSVEQTELAVESLIAAGFEAERHEWSVNFKSRSQVAIQLTTENFYREVPDRAVAADIHGILMRVASLEDTLRGKIKTWSTPERQPSKRLKDLADFARLVESHPELRDQLPLKVKEQLKFVE